MDEEKQTKFIYPLSFYTSELLYIYKITQNVALRCTDVGNYSKGGESVLVKS